MLHFLPIHLLMVAIVPKLKFLSLSLGTSMKTNLQDELSGITDTSTKGVSVFQEQLKNPKVPCAECDNFIDYDKEEELCKKCLKRHKDEIIEK